MREFETWANRDWDMWKLQYSSYINPINDYSFAKYMLWKQYIDWEYRDWANWQKWIPEKSLIESLTRHAEAIKLLFQWYRVVETKKNWIVELFAWNDIDKINPDDFDFYEEKEIVTELNALRFNWEALKLSYLKWQK